MASDSPSFHLVNCKLDYCDWSTLRSSFVQLYADMEEHLKDEHGYSEAEWQRARDDLQEAGAP